MPNSQIKSLTVDGVTYDIVDKTSGYSKIHWVEIVYNNETEKYELDNCTYSDLETFLNDSDSIMIVVYNGVYYYYTESDRGYGFISHYGDVLYIGWSNINQSYYISYNEAYYITTDSLSAHETDPAFTASAAYGISASDITNWNGKSSTDEKLGLDIINHASITSAVYYPIIGHSTNISTTSKRAYDGELKYEFINGTTLDLTIGSSKFKGRLALKNSDAFTRLVPSATTSTTLTLPTSTGTIALTSDIPTKVSDLTNDSGFISSYTETDPTVPSWAKASSKPSYSLTEISGTDDLRAIEGLTGTTGLLKKTAANTWTLDSQKLISSFTNGTNGFRVNYDDGTYSQVTITPSITETDPVFSASAAAGITSTDISNWNAKVSDDKTWNGVSLNKTGATFQWMHGEYFIPIAESASSSTMYYIKATYTPTADLISKYDSNKYLYSTTPSANDNSTKVATTAYVDRAIGGLTIPTRYTSTNTTGYLTMADLPIYDGTVV